MRKGHYEVELTKPDGTQVDVHLDKNFNVLDASRTSTITADIAKVGRIAKSLSLLSYVDNAAHRRKILVQLYRHEKRHELSRQIFHGLSG